MEKDTKQKDLEGNAAPDIKSRGIMFSLKVVDIVSHDKGEKKSIPLFAEIKKDGERLMSVNLVINNLKKEGIDHLTKLLGAKIVKNPHPTPLVCELFIPVGEILDHWENTKPPEDE